jgi:hypothetical protein
MEANHVDLASAAFESQGRVSGGRPVEDRSSLVAPFPVQLRFTSLFVPSRRAGFDNDALADSQRPPADTAPRADECVLLGQFPDHSVHWDASSTASERVVKLGAG